MSKQPPARSFTDLIVWQRAHAFVLKVYEATPRFPQEERFGLAQQFRPAAVSIPANIAEGFRKRSRGDKARFMNIAQGSLEECRYYLILSHDLGFMENTDYMSDLEEVSRLLNAYVRALREPD